MASDVSIVLKELNQKPIAYYPIYKEIMGTTSGGVILSQILYWSSKYDKIWKSDSDLIKETKCTKNEIRNAKTKLKNLPFLKITREGVPATTCYKLNLDELHNHILQLKRPTNKFSGNHESAKNTKSDDKIIKKLISGNHETELVETTKLYTKSTINENTCVKSFSKEKEAVGTAQQHLNGLVCKICGSLQYYTRGGEVCKNGHGGVQGITEKEYDQLNLPKKILKKLKRIGPKPLKKIAPTGLTIFNYSIEAKQILKCWSDCGGKLHVNGYAKGGKAIQNIIDNLLIEGWNPYIKVVDDELKTKQWTPFEICKCIEYYAITLKKDIEEIYFDQFVIYKQRGKFGRSKPDYSILAETFDNLPKDSKIFKYLKKYFDKKYPTVNLYPTAFMNIAKFLESKIDNYSFNDPGNNSSLPLMFVKHIDKQVSLEGKTDALQYMSGQVNLDNFFKSLIKGFRAKKLSRKERAEWLIIKPIMEANRKKALKKAKLKRKGI